MILELQIERFGRFADCRYALGPVTLFIGRNESGKTTLFDIFFQEICRPGLSGRDGRRLKERYGEIRSARLRCDGEPPALEAKEFLNLCAIRSGDISLELAAGGEWLERVKNRLFTGGLDPGLLRARFETLASPRGSLKHNKELKALQEEREALERKLEGLAERRAAVLARERETAGRNRELEMREKEIREAEAVLTRLEAQQAARRRAGEREELNALLDRMEKGERRALRLRALDGFREEELREHDRLAEAREEIGRQAALAGERRAILQEEIRRGEETVLGLERALDGQRRLADTADRLLERAARLRGEWSRDARGRWNRALLTLSFIAPAVGGALALAFPDAVLRAMFLAAGTLLWLFLLLQARPAAAGGRAAAGASPEELVTRLKDEWLVHLGETDPRPGGPSGAAPEAPALRSSSLEGLIAELQMFRARAESASARLAASREELDRLKGEALDLQGREEELARRAAEARLRVEEWLSRRKTSSRDEYLRRVLERRALEEESRRWQEELSAELRRHGCADAARLRRDCERRLGELEREGAAAAPRPGEDPGLLEREIHARREHLERLKADLAGRKERLAREGGEIAGSLGGLPEEIAAVESRVLEIARRMRELNLDREAAALDREIFDRIARDSESGLRDLGRELSRCYGRLLPGAGEVEVPALEEGALRVADRGGEKRPLEHLSRGARDAFLLAARLTLARTALAGKRRGAGLLVLDEPFQALDLERTRLALAMVGGFQRETGWQIILLSKDERLPALAREEFPGLQVYELS